MNVKPTIPAWQMSTEQRNSSQQEAQEQHGNKGTPGVSKDVTDVNGYSASANEDKSITDNDTNEISLGTVANGNAPMLEVVPE